MTGVQTCALPICLFPKTLAQANPNASKKAIGICDALAEKTGPETRRRMTDIFLRCTKMEWLFWDSAWYLESWKI